MIVLDASVLIAYLEFQDPHHVRAEQLLLTLVGEQFGINVLTLAEVLVAPVRAGAGARVERALRAIGVVELPLPAGAAPRLAELRARSGLKLPDCCVLLSGLDVGAIATFDQRLAAAARADGLTVHD